MNKVIIYIPGLHDDTFLHTNAVHILRYLWRPYGFDILVIKPHWGEGNSFAPKLKNIIDTIDKLSQKKKVYLIGQSAGGAAVLNAFVARKNKVSGVVNICGRLIKGKKVFTYLELAAKGNPAFLDSVLLFENQNEEKLVDEDRRKILIVKPLWDEVVPASTVGLSGATTITIPMLFHSLGGVAALTLFSSKIRAFLR